MGTRKKLIIQKSTTGFTLIELLIVISIIGIITSTVVFQHRDASDGLNLDNAANTLALEIRKAQAYGLGVRKFGGFLDAEEGDEYKAGYGVYVDKINYRGSVTFFADHPSDGERGRYDAGSDVGITDVSFLGDVEIVGITADSSSVSSASIVYVRPEPDAKLFAGGNFVAEITITLKSPQDKKLNVVINKEGQVSVQRVPE